MQPDFNVLPDAALAAFLVDGVEGNLGIQQQAAPNHRDDNPGGDFSATWNQFTNSELRFYPTAHPDFTQLRLSHPSLTIAVGIGGARAINLTWQLTNYNWYSVGHGGDPNGLKLQVRLLNRAGGDLVRPVDFVWKMTCEPCFDHAVVQPMPFPDFPQFYREVEQVEIRYITLWMQHCRANPCQPAAGPR